MTGGETSGSRTFLDGLRVIEIGNELGEYCGKLLAGLGADVVRVEPPGGDETRTYGPFQDDEPNPDRSLYFWHYNLGKRSVVLDLDTVEGQEQYRTLVRNADVVVDSRPPGYLEERGLDRRDLMAADPGLLYLRISPFGDDGPWAAWHGSDLVHLALGGVMMNCGYDPDPFGNYDMPPVAPQMWHAYAITGEMAVISLLGALHHRMKCRTGSTSGSRTTGTPARARG
jgi:crotonobetainyl-CoA:carnitine CoA-transferase CaiB-like acyl-CoA transferase